MIFTENHKLGSDCEFTLFYDDIAKKLVGFEAVNNSKQILRFEVTSPVKFSNEIKSGELFKSNLTEETKISYTLSYIKKISAIMENTKMVEKEIDKSVISGIEWRVTLGS